MTEQDQNIARTLSIPSLTTLSLEEKSAEPTMSAKRPNQPTFEGLPLEIRKEIYQYLLVEPNTIIVDETKSYTTTPPSHTLHRRKSWPPPDWRAPGRAREDWVFLRYSNPNVTHTPPTKHIGPYDASEETLRSISPSCRLQVQLCRLNKKISLEARSFLYSENTFFFESSTALRLFLERLGSQEGSNIQDVRMDLKTIGIQTWSYTMETSEGWNDDELRATLEVLRDNSPKLKTFSVSGNFPRRMRGWVWDMLIQVWGAGQEKALIEDSAKPDEDGPDQDMA